MSDSNLTSFLRFTRVADRFFDPSSATTVLDVGSRDGEVALYLKEHFPNSTVYAFDCNPASIRLCRKNLAGKAGVHLVEKAVSNVTGVLPFYAIDDVNVGAGSLYPFDPGMPQADLRRRKIEVPSTTLRDWAEQEHITRIDVIWMDLQGAELRALHGLGDLLETVKVLYTEVEYKPIYEGQPLEEDPAQRAPAAHGISTGPRLDHLDVETGQALAETDSLALTLPEAKITPFSYKMNTLLLDFPSLRGSIQPWSCGPHSPRVSPH